jgi:hypothetical protein
MSPKPSEILRKSHRHVERKERATVKEHLRQEATTAAEALESLTRYVGSCSCGAVGHLYDRTDYLSIPRCGSSPPGPWRQSARQRH